MRKLILFLLLLVGPLNAAAGGDLFQVRVLDYEFISLNERYLLFEPITTPYGIPAEEFLGGAKKVRLLVSFGCSEGFLICIFRERSHSKSEHREAIAHLSKIAKPNEVILIGLISEGFQKVQNKKNTYISNGSFLNENVIYLYVKSH